MDRTLRSPRLPGFVLLLLCAMPSRVDAQQFVCWPIAAGDTASSLARRLTGNAAAAYGFAFQIRDPARRMFVPKSHYQRLQSDWQACVARGPVPDTLVAYAPVVELAESADGARRAHQRANSTGARLSTVGSRSRRSNADRRPLRRNDRRRGPHHPVALGGGRVSGATPHSTIRSARRRELRHGVCTAARRPIIEGSADPGEAAVCSAQTAARDFHCSRSRPSIPQPG